MKHVQDFWRGFSFQHVDYATRHHSRAYDVGGQVACVLLCLAPVAVIFALGFVVGRFV